MRLTLTRLSFTRDICRGNIAVDGAPETQMLTLEASLPRNMVSYVGHALPPGEYKCSCEVSAINYKGAVLHIPWITLNNVQWFPQAQFVQQHNLNAPVRGQIFIGKEYEDFGFSIANHDDEGMKWWARISDKVFKTGEDVTLNIVHDDSLYYTDTYKDKARIDAEEQAERERCDGLISELLGTDLCATS